MCWIVAWQYLQHDLHMRMQLKAIKHGSIPQWREGGMSITLMSDLAPCTHVHWSVEWQHSRGGHMHSQGSCVSKNSWGMVTPVKPSQTHPQLISRFHPWPHSMPTAVEWSECIGTSIRANNVWAYTICWVTINLKKTAIWWVTIKWSRLYCILFDMQEQAAFI